MSVEGQSVAEQATQELAPFQTTEDVELGAVWDRIERDNGAARSEDGKFASPNATDTPQQPLEGGEGEGAEAAVEPSTPTVADVPLPSNWNGKEELWQKIPADLREPLRAMQEELHQRQSQMGRELAAWKPVGEVIQKYGDYFGGPRGNYKPNEAIDYLFSLQRQMDDNPIETLMQIADTYELRPKLAQMFAAQGSDAGSSVLLARIDQLENLLKQANGQKFDPSIIDQRLEQKLTEKQTLSEIEQVMSRVTKDMPLISQVEESDLIFFIDKAKARLGETASYEAVYRLAGEMAINADPDLRAKAAAVQPAAVQDPAKVAAAKRANSANLRSTSPDKGRVLTEEEELAQVWEKAQRA